MVNRLLGVVSVILLLCGTVLAARRVLAQPGVVLLWDKGNAQWIRVDRPLDVRSKQEEFERNTAATFLIRFKTTQPISNAVLHVAALRRVVVLLDDSSVADSGPELQDWKTTYAFPVDGTLPAGQHELRCMVSNRDGPPLVRLSCPELGIATGSSWQASENQTEWKPAALAKGPWDPPIPAVYVARYTNLVLLPIGLGVLFAIGTLLRWRRPIDSRVKWASRVRWLLLIAWAVMGLNNSFKVPIGCGYDAKDHYRYIQFVAEKLSLPRPDSGWQTFQSPLYYMVSAVVYRGLKAAGVSLDAVQYLLRWIPLVSCGLLIEICYRAGRAVFPGRGDLQIITMLIGSLAPVNLYMAQTVSNEPMAAALSGVLILIILRMLRDPRWGVEPMSLLMAGLTLGFAILTKINALLWAAPLAAAIAIALNDQKVKPLGWLRSMAIVATGTVAVVGWLIVRNVRMVGKPFYLNTSVANQNWWQDPGFRTPDNFYEFGHVFSRPIYNGMASVWDSLYGSLWGNGILSGHAPWNTYLMYVGLFLSILPTLAIGIGMVRSVLGRPLSRPPEILQVATLAIGCFVAAIVYVYLTLPIYSCAKASYLLSTLPCLGLLAAAGLAGPFKIRWVRALLGGVLISWAATGYLTFMVLY